jgi:glucose dehydrogenase
MKGRLILPVTILIAILVVSSFLGIDSFAVQSRSGTVDWTMMNANSNGTNAVEQTQIGSENLNQLARKWVFPIPNSPPVVGLDLTGNGSISPPLSVNGTVYIVTNYLRVYAIDSSDGAVIWSYQAHLNRTGLPLSHLSGHMHGLDFYRGQIWISLPDCSVVGLDANTGKTDYHIARICADIPGNTGLYDSSGNPPMFYREELIWLSSVSEGTDVGRGFVAAYNLTTAALLWRWFVTPGSGGDPSWDVESCSPQSCHGNVPSYPGDWGIMGSPNGLSMVGAGPSFGQPAVDEKAGVVYLSTSQPSPDWNATYRPGPNLYSDSIVALNVTNGKMIWYYQSTPHDLWDFDCGWNVVLGSILVYGADRATVFKACKNGYVYALDASTGSLLWYFDPPSVKRMGTGNADYVATGSYNPTQRWINYPSVGEFEQCPGANGAIESDVSLSHDLLYVATFNFCAFGFVAPVNVRGASLWGVRQLAPDFSHANTTIYALNASSGRVVWSYFLPQIAFRGWLSSSNGVVYAGALDGYIHAFDAMTGREISRLDVGLPLYESPTIGSTRKGDTVLLQLTSPSSYGAFAANQTGYLIAYGLPPAGGLLLEYLVFGLAGATGGIATVAFVYWFRASRGRRRGAGPR